jgi:hypothetical protein
LIPFGTALHDGTNSTIQAKLKGKPYLASGGSWFRCK